MIKLEDATGKDKLIAAAVLTIVFVLGFYLGAVYQSFKAVAGTAIQYSLPQK